MIHAGFLSQFHKHFQLSGCFSCCRVLSHHISPQESLKKSKIIDWSWLKSFKWSQMFWHFETVVLLSLAVYFLFSMLTWLYDSCRLCWWGVTAASACLLYTHLLTLALSHSSSLLFQMNIRSYFQLNILGTVSVTCCGLPHTIISTYLLVCKSE